MVAIKCSKKKYDVFLAYHGTYETGGSYEIANKLFEYLTNQGLSCFFFPKTDHVSYKSNVIDVIASRTFLLICNQSIHLNHDGEINKQYHYELSTEIDTFYGMVQLGTDVQSKDAKIFVADENWKRGSEQKFHPLFDARTHFYLTDNNLATIFINVKKWIDTRLIAQSLKHNSLSEHIQAYFKRSILTEDISIRNLITHAKFVYAAGISNTELMNVDYDIYKNSLARGCIFKIIYLDPSCDETANREKEEGVRKGRIKTITENNLQIAEDIYDEINENVRQNFKIYLYRRVPRINILIIDDIAILQFYDSFNRGMFNPSFLIKKKSEYDSMYQYCMDKFNELLEVSEEVTW